MLDARASCAQIVVGGCDYTRAHSRGAEYRLGMEKKPFFTFDARGDGRRDDRWEQVRDLDRINLNASCCQIAFSLR